MVSLQNVLPEKLFDIVERAGIATTTQILTMSSWDIKMLTNLNMEDIVLLKNLVGELSTSIVSTGYELYKQKLEEHKVAVGDAGMNTLLRGGLQRGSLTELYGESGSGKTQLAVQTAAHNWKTGTVYICTEDPFPVKRFNQFVKGLPGYKANIDYGKHIFIEYVIEPNDLLSCVRVRLPKLLETKTVSLIVIDSVAGPFRNEQTNYVQRSEELRELAMCLLRLAQNYRIAVLCINQVTASFNDDNVMPALGLAWSNMVATRLCIKKTTRSTNVQLISNENLNTLIRELIVVFSPELPHLKTELIITEKCIQSVS